MAKILIVDDSETLRSQLKEALEGKSHSVIEGEDGADGLEKATANEGVDLVITDFNMPEMDGITMVKKIKDIERYSKTPVFMLTTESTPQLMASGKEAGVMAWIVKPFDEEELLEVIDEIA